MKKVISLILVTLMVTMLLAGCSNSSEVAELRQESELSQVKEQMSEMQSTTPVELPETTETVTSDMLDYLTTQLKSNYYADWNAVATCNYATEEHLLAVAKQCAAIPYLSENWAKTIATSICENPAATGRVIKELSSSTLYAVWNIAAQSTHADEEALISIAKECAAIPYLSENWAKTIATSICENPAVTGKVIKELASSNFTIVTAIAHEKMEEMK